MMEQTDEVITLMSTDHSNCPLAAHEVHVFQCLDEGPEFGETPSWLFPNSVLDLPNSVHSY